MKYSVQYVIDMFNSGDYDFLDSLSDDRDDAIDYLITLLTPRGKVGELDIQNIYRNIEADNVNRVFHRIYETLPETQKIDWLKKLVATFFSDMYFDNETESFIYDGDIDSFKLFYCGDGGYGRDMSSKDLIKYYFSNMEDGYYHYDTVYDLYDDVIDNLNGKNKSILGERLIECFGGVLIDGESTSLLELLNGGDDVTLNKDNILEIINDKETMKYIIELIGDGDGNCEDIISDLYSLHSASYNYAYESEVSRYIKDSMSEIFDYNTLEFDSEKENIKVSFKKESILHMLSKYINEYQDGLLADSIPYWGSISSLYMNGVNDTVFDCLKLRLPDYPDYREVESNINELFSDYI